MNYILINKKSKNATSISKLEEVLALFDGKATEIIDVIGLDYQEFFNKVNETDEITLVGGDGTLNHFVNDVHDYVLPCKVFFYANGTGNDFFNDMEKYVENKRVYLNNVIKNLPYCLVKDKKYYFINGIGFGIDGYCCEEGDRKQAKSDKPVNYTSIAINGLLFHYKAPNAKVTVDGVTKEYKKVWLAPTMKGRFYGGGMNIAPNQDRFEESGLLTNVVMHKSGKLKTLIVFPSIFKGEHIKHTEMIEVRTGHDFIVEFDRPTALQVDGETVVGVTRYEVHTK